MCVHACVWMCLLAYVCMETKGKLGVPFCITLNLTGSDRVLHRTLSLQIGQTDSPEKPRKLTISTVHKTGLANVSPPPYHAFMWLLGTQIHVCKANTLPREPSPQLVPAL